MVDKCPICHSSAVHIFLERVNVPVHQNLVIRNQSAAQRINRGDLLLAVCESCGFVFNREFQPSKLRYDGSYDNTQTHSPVFEQHVNALIRYILDESNVSTDRIVEVGCGKGVFLRRLVEAAPGAVGHGFDSTYEGPAIDLDGRLRFYQRYYEASDLTIEPTIVLCRHVIEHVPKPLDLLDNIRHTLIGMPGARVFFETPCVEWILTHRAIWDFFYEHCSYFSRQSLATAFERSGFQVDCVRHVFGGQYLWLEASLASEHRTSPQENNAGNVVSLAQQFAIAETGMKRAIQVQLQTLAAKDGVALWGAGAKGVTLANLVDPNLQWITCIVDLNPNKQGKYLPGTGHPIVDYRRLTDLDVTTVINMNPNYYTENQQLLRSAQMSIRLIDLADWTTEQ